MSVGESDELDRTVEGAAGAHQRLLARLDEALEAGTLDPAVPSRLPGWTVGHVLTHLARNADSMVRVLDGLPQYEHGADGRADDIERGAGRPADVLVDDVRTGIWRLETRWAAPVDWDATSEVLSEQRVRRAEVPFRRWRETEVHHVDLGLGYEFGDLPTEYVRRELRVLGMLWNARRPMGMTGLPPRAIELAPPERLAWLLGRVEVDALDPAGLF